MGEKPVIKRCYHCQDGHCPACDTDWTEMTDQELADAIRKRFGRIERRSMIFNIEKLLRDHPPVVPDPPCTIDQVPGWTVHTDANGNRFACYADSSTRYRVRREKFHPDGVLEYNKVHPWPDPPQYQPGDLVDIDTGANWHHNHRTFVGYAPDGSVVFVSEGQAVTWPAERVRPHVEGTE